MSWRTRASLGWLEGLPGVQRQRPLAKHTSFNIGGPAEFFVEAGSTVELAGLVAGAARRGVPHLMLGAGTNLLVSDQGVEGLVIRCTARQFRIEGDRIHAEAGLKMLRLARVAAAADLVGLEFGIGIPGTVGGAVYQDAGCWGKEIREVLVGAQGVAATGSPVVWRPDELGLGYRTSAFRIGALRGAVVTAATFQLQPGDGASARQAMGRMTLERSRSQPIRTKNCGSVFKNPASDSAGRLVEAAGMKGVRVGGASVSRLHANFIVNEGGATAGDVVALIEQIRARVRDSFGVELEPEVEKVGRW